VKVFPVYDYDGNGYDTVVIGMQVWLKQNMRTLRYSNGDSLEFVEEYNKWPQLMEGGCSYYDNDKNNADTFGLLYNYYAVKDSRNICPVGWHVPSVSEWDTLIEYLARSNFGFNGDGEDIAKSLASAYGWISDNTTSGTVGHDQQLNNLTGFSATPSGHRVGWGVFGEKGKQAIYWSSSLYYKYAAYYYSISYKYSYLSRNTSTFNSGFAIRCIKDN